MKSIRVKCVDDRDMNNITKDKVYVVAGTAFAGSKIWIINDLGELGHYDKTRFVEYHLNGQ
ncbi:MAG: hypothetical protein ACRCXX_08150 [Cetobacterium sp.]|uniref:hypothetical protein n=1 Tax=Cetobacterium sp. TaxID=2071632 RepID=UPI003F2D72DA